MSDVKISAEPLAVSAMCKFTIDRPVYENRSYWFGRAAHATSSPLARRLFAIPGITTVLISHNAITLTKAAPSPWQVVGPHVGAAIREHIASGEVAVDESLHAKLPAADEIRRRVEDIIATEVAPGVASHGGSISIVAVKDNVVLLKMGGGCQGCSSATATLKIGVEAAIRRAVPEVGEIIDTTDHSAGNNPYYTAT